MNGRERLIEIIKIINDHNILKNITPVNLRETLEDLGPTYIKIGQILSNRPDLVPEEYIKELSKLRSDVSPMSYNELLSIINEELDDNKIAEIVRIDKEPLGSASIAQVHKAVLKNNEEVVIKVQRRNIKEIMTSDIRVLKKACSVLHVNELIKGVVKVDEVLDELLNTSLEEMDFIKEANNIEEFKSINEMIHYIRVPKVYKNLSTDKVLVMEYIEGINIYNKQELINNGYDLDEIGKKLANNYIYQAIDCGFFHADPHPDNLFINEGKIVYLDFGMVGKLNTRNKDILNKMIESILEDDIKVVERCLILLSDNNKSVNHTKLRENLRIILDSYKDLPIQDIDISSFITDVMKLLSSNGITLQKDITMLVRGIIVIEGTLELISPNISLIDVFSNRLANSTSIINKDNISKEVLTIVKSMKDLTSIPHDIHNTLNEITNGDVKFNVEVTDSNKQIDRLEKMVHRVVVCALDVAFIVGASLIASKEIVTKEQKFLFYLYIVIATVFTIWLFIKMYIDKLNRKK